MGWEQRWRKYSVTGVSDWHVAELSKSTQALLSVVGLKSRPLGLGTAKAFTAQSWGCLRLRKAAVAQSP